MRPNHSVTLCEKKQLTQDTWHFTLQVSNKDFFFEAGQFISLVFTQDDQSFRRSYSIANAPCDYKKTGKIELVIRCLEQGKGSQFLLACDKGTQIKMLGPFGVFNLPRKNLPKRLILLATGTGIAPYRAMLPEILKLHEQGMKIILLQGVRTRVDYLYAEQLEALNTQGFLLGPCYSQEKIPRTYEYLGYVQQQFSWIKPNPETDLVYVCGTPAMIDESVQKLTELGFGSKQIRREKYLFSGH